MTHSLAFDISMKVPYTTVIPKTVTCFALPGIETMCWQLKSFTITQLVGN